MEPMTSHERFRRMFTHLEADRVPIIDSPWDSTIERWQNEGMPKDVSYVDYFGLDKMVTPFLTDNSPQYPAQVLSESETDITCTSPWGVTMRQWKHAASTVEFLGFTIVDADSWSKAKERIHPSRVRAPPDHPATAGRRRSIPRWVWR